jgi:phenylpropionate dioxygenase-like ring-hydroxylating dioxygenase large terminal subunit
MEREEQVRSIKEMLAFLDSSTTVDAGGIRENPTSVYVDTDHADHELREFFCLRPQLIGLSGDLPETGSFITLNELSVPILATRDEAGTFRAFVNTCRHRGVILEESPRGDARRFVCPFHNWTYATDGALVGLPKQEHVGITDTSCLGLVELPSVESDGLLWVHPNPEGELDVAALLGDDLSGELEHWDLGGLEYLASDSYDIACNWKFAMDTFGETYHFPVLHKDTLSFEFHGNVQCYDTFGMHHRMLLCRREIDEMRLLPEAEWNISAAALPVYWLFPNVQLMPFDEGLYLLRAYPVPGDPGRHISKVSFYLRPPQDGSDQARETAQEVARGFSEVIRDEDYVMAASQQRSAESGAVQFSVFGRNEPALHHYHNTYRRALGMQDLPLLQSVSETF